MTSPPSSSVATSSSGRSARSEAVSAATCSGSVMLRPKSTTPPSPSASSRFSQSGTVSPSNPGKRQAAASLEPRLTANRAAVSPNPIFRCTIRKKTITGIAISVEPAIRPPQSVLRLVP